MKFKKNWKRFWTLDRHHAEGFTLVELIVVIAILAILGGVAVPAYSGYVKKANMAADQTLVSEVANALLLQYYSDPDAATGGYVVLSTSGAEGDGDDGVGTKAMNAAFGEGWTETAALKYDGWTDDGMLSYVVSNADSATTVANSNYFTNSTPDKLVGAFSSLTDALSGMAATAAKDPMETLKNIGAMSNEQLTEMREDLNNLGLSWSTEADADNSAYSTALSNLMVKYVSDELANVDTNDENPEISTLATAAVRYAMVYGWASSSEAGSNTLATLNSTITSGNADASTILDTIFNVDASEGSDFYNYLSNDSSLTDQTAFLTIMGAVSDFSQDFDMTTAGLYSSGSISDMVNNYASAVTAVAGMTSEQIASLSSTSSGTVVIFISENGSVAVTPASAYAGN